MAEPGAAGEAGLEVGLSLAIGRLRLALTLRTDARVIALTGPSGIGKSTALRALAGLERRGTGVVRFAGETWQDTAARAFVPPHARRVGWVPQDACLFPHLSVRANLGYAGARATDIDAIAGRLGLDGLLDRRPRHLSGGERQRVALGRALLASPRLLLLDEPFAALDDALRAALAADLAALCRDRGLRCVVVSHHPGDVAALADEVWRIASGRTERALSG